MQPEDAFNSIKKMAEKFNEADIDGDLKRQAASLLDSLCALL